jgi:hypothetical protein
MANFEPPASPESLAPMKENVGLEQPHSPRAEATEPQPTFEERFGRNGTLILTLIVLVVVFLVGYVIFK